MRFSMLVRQAIIINATLDVDGEDNRNKQYIPNLMMIDCSWSKKHLL